MVVEAGEEGLTAAEQFYSLAASSPHRQGQLPLHDLLSKICDKTQFCPPPRLRLSVRAALPGYLRHRPDLPLWLSASKPVRGDAAQTHAEDYSGLHLHQTQNSGRGSWGKR